MDARISDIKVGHRHRQDMGDIKSLAGSIEALGLLHPIVVTPGMELIAGERRLEAFKILGRDSIPVTVVALDEIVRGEFAENAFRKTLLPSEIDAIRQLMEPAERAAAKERQSRKLSGSGGGETRDKIGTFAGVSGRTVGKIASVVEAAEAEPEKYGKLLEDMDRTGRVDGPFKRLVVLRKAEDIAREPPPLPSGPFRVIVADPPWPYEVRKDDHSHRGTQPYPQMSIDQIKALPVPDIAGDDCILWLWTTNHHMDEAFDVLDAWGFQQKTILTWNKGKMGMGDWLRGQTEHCLMAVRGRPIVTLTNQTTLITGPVREHSRKPDEFYAFVESLCPGAKAELFQRYPREGWIGHGDEVGKAA